MEQLETKSDDKKGNPPSHMTDCGIYAYLSVCSICLGELFPGECNAEFNEKYVRSLCRYFRVKETQENVMMVLVMGDSGQDTKPYVSLLMNEPGIDGRGILVIQLTVFIAVQSGEYDARQRVLVRKLSDLFLVPFDLVELYEHSLVSMLNDDEPTVTEEEQRASDRRRKIKKIKRYASVGIATLAGGTLIGLTGGLAAPLIGVGVGTILGGATTVALTSTAGVTIIGSIFGVAGAGLTGYKMNKRVGHLEEFSFQPLSCASQTDSQLHIAIAITGWLKSEDPGAILRPWRCLAISREQYALRYETKYLVELGQALEYILSMAVSFATQEALKYTILSGLMSAIAWPTALLSISSVIDNPWSVCCRRSSEVGKHLAHVLLSRQHGKRPVTLIGYSLGARVIFYCLREMCQTGGKNALGIVQDAILLGAPVTADERQWGMCSRIVAGRVVNGYARSDWLLRFLYRTFSMTTAVAGLMPLNHSGIENIDLGAVVGGHMEYSEKLEDILRLVGVKLRPGEILDDYGLLRNSTSEYDQRNLQRNLSTGDLKESKSDTCLSKALPDLLKK
ncbi:transmembrane and coiled-coil domain-containing protein 4-like isoform X2 [Fopius arisanus]|uniref:Transmembrane and coiled-coil domain-containing protein 4-like isoform X2 n=1 Tax=Fopius arisanus TaxID=64838 RepID=A0A9R1T2B2_9HYME|nr:PREDICTED: transmembrane and coiled-coil domain-containing protein 4-like isoform X2 [Fopius arisanus]